MARGARGIAAKRIQEWLCLHGCGIPVDGHFGGVTEAALRQFQRRRRMRQTGKLTKTTHDALVKPMTAALTPLASAPRLLGTAVVRQARAHLRQQAREVGGQNRGPWVRLYMDGNEGDDWLWCAGFVSFVVTQAAELTATKAPFRKTYSCDSLATQAQSAGTLITDKAVRADNSLIAPGTIFLSRKTHDDWVHTGIVVRVESTDVIQTIEGNTNDEGSREGREVCMRMRGVKGKDFIVPG